MKSLPTLLDPGLSDVERLGPMIYRFPMWEAEACESFISDLESRPDDWITPDRAEELAARPEVASSFPVGFDLVELIQRRRIREFPLYSIDGFKDMWEEQGVAVMDTLSYLWGRKIEEVIPPFVFAYAKAPGLKSKLELHVDSYNTLVLPLSNPAEYTGGGTYLMEHDLTITYRQGHSHVFPGHSFYCPPGVDPKGPIDDGVVDRHPELLHCTHSVRSGTSYVLVGFYR